MVRLPKDERYLALVGYFTARDGTFGKLGQSRAGPIGVFDSAIAQARPTNDLERTLAIDTLPYLPGDLLVKMDIATMASSLEGRSPFLDHRLVEFVSHLPPRMKF